jgi:hypothetical protein
MESCWFLISCLRMILYGANQERLLLRCTLLCFEAISGLKVNFAKSELVPVGEVQGVVELTHIVSCKVSSFTLSC